MSRTSLFFGGLSQTLPASHLANPKICKFEIFLKNASSQRRMQPPPGRDLPEQLVLPPRLELALRLPLRQRDFRRDLGERRD